MQESSENRSRKQSKEDPQRDHVQSIGDLKLLERIFSEENNHQGIVK